MVLARDDDSTADLMSASIWQTMIGIQISYLALWKYFMCNCTSYQQA